MLRKLSNPINILKKVYLLLQGRAVVIEVDQLSKLMRSHSLPETMSHCSNDVLKMRPPVFIIGPPRSGSTYLVAALNQHENIYITNELRVMSFINDLFRLFLKNSRLEWNLGVEERENFVSHFRSQMTIVVKNFYAKRLKKIDDVWGDKHPHYADPAMDPGALDTILELFPDAKFIHLYRHPYAQINSYVKKGWKDFQYAVLAYRRIVTVGQSLGRRVGPSQYIEISYEDLCDYGEVTMKKITEFLAIPPSESLNKYMHAQELERTPYSSPITPKDEIGRKKDYEFTIEQRKYMNKILGETSKLLGYTLY